MAATSPPAATPSAQAVGNAFVEQYYHILHQSPELVYRFYQNSSVVSRPGSNGVMMSVRTMSAIDKMILSLDYKDCTAEIKTVDAQDSYKEGMSVLVTGCLTTTDNVGKKFTQSFFLAPQDKGYFVLNDIFRYVDENVAENISVSVNETSESIPVAPMTPDPEMATASPPPFREVFLGTKKKSSPAATPSPQVVGNAFVEQYYHILHQSPELVYRFYQNSSVVSRPGSNGVMMSVRTMRAINEMILSLDYKDCPAPEIKTVDAQDSFNGGVVVLVTGCLTTKKNNVGKKFTQSFFLAPQDKGYFVLNDIFRYVDVEDVEDVDDVEDVEYVEDVEELHVPKRKKPN